MSSDAAIRDHLVRALSWAEAHATYDQAVEGIPEDKRGVRPPGFEYSAWQLIEHLRLAQDDLLDFCRNASYVHTLTWPDDYWPKSPAPPDAAAWVKSVASFQRARTDFERVVKETPDLSALVPTGKDNQTYLRAILLVIDHNAYHVGQVLAVRRALGIWPS